MNETKSWVFEKIFFLKLINLEPDSSQKRGPKSKKSEMKKEKLQLTPQKCKGS